MTCLQILLLILSELLTSIPPWKNQNTFVFLIISRGMEVN